MLVGSNYLSLCEESEANRERYREEAERHVATREYTTYKRYDLTPYDFERKREPRDMRVTHPKGATAYDFEYKQLIDLFLENPDRTIRDDLHAHGAVQWSAGLSHR
ncbi:hypothetical protein [Paenibacillus xanthanilyticus]|uniref:Uncharacterized protein n=1 Tax=Paenibacillus xanthanilyticus TaxID=1783531 RepID=A0ABV8K6P1_9BACL